MQESFAWKKDLVKIADIFLHNPYWPLINLYCFICLYEFDMWL